MKKILSLLLALVLAFCFAACTGENGEAQSEQPSETQPQTVQASTVEELEQIVLADVADTVASYQADWKKMNAQITTYSQFTKNIDEVESFYTKLINGHASLCEKMCTYSLQFAQMILSSGSSTDEKYDDLEIIYDCIYEDAGDEIYDGFYDGILQDMYDAFYDGILDDAYDSEPYKEWSDVCSDEYDRWSDASSDIYDAVSDMRSDVYDFYSDLRGDMWDDDAESANARVEKFAAELTDSSSASVDTTAAAATQATEKANDDDVDADLKAFCDEYEVFMDDYVDFMKKYRSSKDVSGMLSDYADMMQQYTEFAEKASQYDTDEMSPADAAYFLEVTGRIQQKLLDISG